MRLSIPNKFLSILFCSLLGLVEANAQTLQKSAQKIKSYKNLSYTDIVRMKFSFQDDFSSDTLVSQLLILPKEQAGGGYYLLKSSAAAYAFDGNKLARLNLTDSTYTVQKESVDGQNTRTLLYWAQNMDNLTQLSLKKIKQLKDTAIDNIAYTNIKVTKTDIVENNVHQYNITNFIIDKKSNLPVHIINQMKGYANDGSVFQFIETHSYSSYQFDNKNFPILSIFSIPAHFRVPPKRIPAVFLPNGTPAPSIEAFDLSGNAFDLEQLKGKMVLLNFSLIGCPHCVGAAQMLNRLHEKYKEKGLVIVNIYPLDQKEAIVKFDQRENVKTPSYISEKALQVAYPYDGYPSFYLLDKNGLVAQSYNGYYKDLESELTVKIESINK